MADASLDKEQPPADRPPSYRFRDSLLDYLSHDELIICLMALSNPLPTDANEVYKKARCSAKELILAETIRRQRIGGVRFLTEKKREGAE